MHEVIKVVVTLWTQTKTISETQKSDTKDEKSNRILRKRTIDPYYMDDSLCRHLSGNDYTTIPHSPPFLKILGY